MGGGVFALYLLTLCPTVHWLDSGELIGAAWQLAGAHPPGEASFLLFAQGLIRLPAASIAWRTNLFSALGLAAGAVLFFHLARTLMDGLLAAPPRETSPSSTPLPPPKRSTGWAILLASAPFLTYPMWIQAVRAEVYTLGLLLTLVTLACAVRAGVLTRHVVLEAPSPLDARWLALGALAGGLNLTVHPLLAGLAGLPLVGLLLWPSLRSPRTLPWRVWAPSLAAGLLGLSSLLFLPLRSIANPEAGWGDASNVMGLLDILLARSFQQNFSPLTLTVVGDNLSVLLEVFSGTPGPALMMLALVGSVLLFTQPPPSPDNQTSQPTATGPLCPRRTGVLLLGLIACNLTSILTQNKVMPDNPDLHGYLLITHLCLWLLAGLGLRLGLERRFIRPLPMSHPAEGELQAPPARISRVLERGAFALLGVLWISTLPLGLPAVNRSQDHLASLHARSAFEALRPGALLLTSGNSTMFGVQYLQVVEGKRPDVLVLPRALLSHAWFRHRLPVPPALLDAARSSIAQLIPQVAERPLRIELREPDLVAASLLCPMPAPGWGFYDAHPCPPGKTTPTAGLLQMPQVQRGPEALAVGLQAHLLLARWYDQVELPDRAEQERRFIRVNFPAITLPEY